MSSAPPGSRPSKPARSGARRSWLLPIYVGVIAIAGILAWQVFDSRGDGGEIQTIEGEPDEAITAFWVDQGSPILVRSRELLPSILLDISEGETCLPTSDVAAARCPDIAESLATNLNALRALIGDARGVTPPADSSAEEWVDLQAAGLEQLAAFVERFQRLAEGGWERADAGWRLAAEEFGHSEDLLGASELQLAKMLGEVEPEQRNPFDATE